MNGLKKVLGIVWIIIAIASILALFYGAIHNIDTNGKADINRPLPWIIIIAIFTPISIGMMIFGWYAFKGEYDNQESIE